MPMLRRIKTFYRVQISTVLFLSCASLPSMLAFAAVSLFTASSNTAIAQSFAEEQGKLTRLQSAHRKAKATLTASNNEIATIEATIKEQRAALKPLKAEYINGKRSYDATVIDAGDSPTASQQAKIDNEKFKFYLVERKYEKANKELAELEEQLVALKRKKASAMTSVNSLGKDIIAQRAIIEKSQDWAKQAEAVRQREAQEEQALLRENREAQAEIARLKRLLAEKAAAEKRAAAQARQVATEDTKPRTPLSELDEVTAPSSPRTTKKATGTTSAPGPATRPSSVSSRPATPPTPSKPGPDPLSDTQLRSVPVVPTRNEELVNAASQRNRSDITQDSDTSQTELPRTGKQALKLRNDRSGLNIHRYHLRTAMDESAFPASRQPRRILLHNPTGNKRSTATALRAIGGNQYSTLLRLKGDAYFFRVGEYEETIDIPEGYSGQVFTIYFDGSPSGPDINISPKSLLP